MDTMRAHFVTFYSPGTLVAEQTTRSIEEWDIHLAVDMSRSITERHNAKPYCFVFTTKERGLKDLDSKQVARSGCYYLGGEVLTLEEVKAECNSKNAILIQNMECNGYERIVRNNNSWRWTQPLYDDDVVLDMKEYA